LLWNQLHSESPGRDFERGDSPTIVLSVGPYRFGHGIFATTRRDSPRISAVPDCRVLQCLLCHGSIFGIGVSVDEGFQGQAGNVKTVLSNGLHSSVEHHLIWLPKANFGYWRACRQAAKQRADQAHGVFRVAHTTPPLRLMPRLGMELPLANRSRPNSYTDIRKSGNRRDVNRLLLPEHVGRHSFPVAFPIHFPIIQIEKCHPRSEPRRDLVYNSFGSPAAVSSSKFPSSISSLINEVVLCLRM
jgi:hypothetical protein